MSASRDDGITTIELKEEREWDDAPAAGEVKRGLLRPRDALAMPLSELLHSADKELLRVAVASGDAPYSGKVINTSVIDSNTEVLLNQKIMLAMLEQQSENQIKIMKQLARHETYFKELRSKINNSAYTIDENTDEKHSPVCSVKQLETLEKNLKDWEFRKSYIRVKSSMFPKGCGLGCLPLCNRLLDSVLNRDILSACSWMGNSWDKLTDNTPFKKFQWVRASFLRIVNKVHPKFSQLECDQFFKAVIRSAKAARKRRKGQSPRTEESPGNGSDIDEAEMAPDNSETMDRTDADAAPPAGCEEQVTRSAPSSPVSIEDGPDIEFLALNASHGPSGSHGNEVLYNQKIMLALLEQQSANQTKIMNRLAKHEAYLQELSSSLNKTYLTEPPEPEYTEEPEHPPVRSKEDLEILEDNLKNPEFRKSYIQAKSRMFPADCELRGLAVCYKLIDEVLTRELLAECSWTGGSRDETADKTPFKYFDRVRAAFFAIVNKVDQGYSQLDCDKFLKLVIRNSRARLRCRMLRTSAPKNRKKRPRTG